MQLLHTLRGHRGPVRSCSFRPDGARLVTVSYDKTGKVWDTSLAEAVSCRQAPCAQCVTAPLVARW